MTVDNDRGSTPASKRAPTAGRHAAARLRTSAASNGHRVPPPAIEPVPTAPIEPQRPPAPAAVAPSRRRWSLLARTRYRLDLALSHGALAVIGYLAAITLAVVVIAAGILTTLHMTGVNGGARLGFAEAFWQSLLRMLGKGSFASDQHWATRLLNLAVTLTGIFVAGALIALIAAALNQRIARLRKGRSPVLERDHTLVLGWSPRLGVVVSELVIANANHRNRAIVILAERAKDEMEDELRRLVPDTKTTRVVCRTGDPGKRADLELVNVQGARSVIVLAGDDGDAGVVKAVLEVRSVDPTFTDTRLVAELFSVNHAETLRTLTDQRIATIQADQLISQVTAQACHQNGLAAIFRRLLGFADNDIYFTGVPELVGHTYRESLHAFDTSSVMGLCRGGVVILNPPGDFTIGDQDEIIAIATDDDAEIFTGIRRIPEAEVASIEPFVERPQQIALAGWSPLGVEVIRELDQFLGEGSVIDLLIDGRHFPASEVQVPQTHRCQVNVHILPPAPEALLDVIGDRNYDQAIVLGYRHHHHPAKSDAHTMLTLLAMHKAWAGLERRPRVVAEMLDRSNVDTAQTTGVDDFIVSDELSSLMLAQVSERLELLDVFRELFDADGSFVGLHPAPLYAPEHAVQFASIVAAAGARDESALGYCIGADPVVLNPPKSAMVRLGAADRVLVLGLRGERPADLPVGTAAPTPARAARAVTPRMRSRALRESRRPGHSATFM